MAPTAALRTAISVQAVPSVSPVCLRLGSLVRERLCWQRSDVALQLHGPSVRTAMQRRHVRRMAFPADDDENSREAPTREEDGGGGVFPSLAATATTSSLASPTATVEEPSSFSSSSPSSTLAPPPVTSAPPSSAEERASDLAGLLRGIPTENYALDLALYLASSSFLSLVGYLAHPTLLKVPSQGLRESGIWGP